MKRAHYGVVAAGLALMVAFPDPVSAHAILMRSEPAAGGTVPSGPVTVVLEYNSRIDFGRSLVRLSGPDRTDATLTLDRQAANVAGVHVTLPVPGAYTLRWQVLATDGHLTRGIVPFTVAAAPGAVAAAAPGPAGN